MLTAACTNPQKRHNGWPRLRDALAKVIRIGKQLLLGRQGRRELDPASASACRERWREFEALERPGQKAGYGLRLAFHACVDLVSDEIDPDRLALARALSTQAGMLFEDASAKAILIGGLSTADLARTVGEVRNASRDAEVLLSAAAVLLEAAPSR